jgi:hypothetical protein
MATVLLLSPSLRRMRHCRGVRERRAIDSCPLRRRALKVQRTTAMPLPTAGMRSVLTDPPGQPERLNGQGMGCPQREFGRACWQVVLSDPNLVEQGPILWGFLVVADAGGDECGRSFVEDRDPWCLAGDDAIHLRPQLPGGRFRDAITLSYSPWSAHSAQRTADMRRSRLKAHHDTTRARLANMRVAHSDLVRLTERNGPEPATRGCPEFRGTSVAAPVTFRPPSDLHSGLWH